MQSPRLPSGHLAASVKLTIVIPSVTTGYYVPPNIDANQYPGEQQCSSNDFDGVLAEEAIFWREECRFDVDARSYHGNAVRADGLGMRHMKSGPPRASNSCGRIRSILASHLLDRIHFVWNFGNC